MNEMNKCKNNGITLIALIITIIVMLILVAVTISMAINGGLFGYAGNAARETQDAKEQEEDWANVEGLTTDELIEKYTTEPLKKLHITNYNELCEFATRVNNGEEFDNYIVYLDSDIEIEDEDWIVIGTPGTRDEEGYSFEGIFEGNNHTITNLTITTSRNCNGFFCVNKGTIQNLNVEFSTSNILGSYVGAIAGGNGGTIKNCNVLVDINSSIGSDLGGISGINSGTINNCISRGNMEVSGRNNRSAGGISGDNSGTIFNCKNYTEIMGSNDNVGGISGVLSGDGTIERCLNSGEIYGSATYIGGIVGYGKGVSVISCVNKGDIHASVVNQHSGGICGRSSNISIINCYNTGKGINKNNMNYVDVSGIVADYLDDSVVENCYSIGEVSSYNAPIHRTTLHQDGFSNCYYNNEIYTGTSENNATGLTTAQMKHSSFITMLGDAYKADTNNINNGYPILSWE